MSSKVMQFKFLFLVVVCTSISLHCMDTETIVALWKNQKYTQKKIEMNDKELKQTPSVSIKRHNGDNKKYQIFRDNEAISDVLDASIFDSLGDQYLRTCIDMEWNNVYPSSRYALNKDGTLLAVAGPRAAVVAKVESSSLEKLVILSQCSEDDEKYERCVHCGEETTTPKSYYSWITMNNGGTEVMLKSKKDGILKFTLCEDANE